MTINAFQRRANAALGPGCAGRREELLRAVLGLTEKAGAVARVVRSDEFCHNDQPPDKAGLIKAIGDTTFWLAIICEKSGLKLEDFFGAGQ